MHSWTQQHIHAFMDITHEEVWLSFSLNEHTIDYCYITLYMKVVALPTYESLATVLCQSRGVHSLLFCIHVRFATYLLGVLFTLKKGL